MLKQKSLARGDRATPSEAPWAHPAGSRLSALAMLAATGFSGLTSRSSGAGLCWERGFRARPPRAVFPAHVWRARPPRPRASTYPDLRRHHGVKMPETNWLQRPETAPRYTRTHAAQGRPRQRSAADPCKLTPAPRRPSSLCIFLSLLRPSFSPGLLAVKLPGKLMFLSENPWQLRGSSVHIDWKRVEDKITVTHGSVAGPAPRGTAGQWAVKTLCIGGVPTTAVHGWRPRAARRGPLDRAVVGD